MKATRAQSYSRVARGVASRLRPGHRFLIGVDGPAGAGKSTFAARLADALEDLGYPPAIVYFDDFWAPSARHSIYFRSRWGEGPAGDYDYQWSRFRQQVLMPLRRGQPPAPCGERPRATATDWRSVRRRAVVIVEGFSCLRRELAGAYDLRVFVQAPRDLRLSRLARRDGERYRGWYKVYWMPEEEHYLRQHRPAHAADVVVDTAGPANDALDHGVFRASLVSIPCVTD